LKLLLDALHAAPTPEDARLILKSRAATQMPLSLTLDAAETNNFNITNYISRLNTSILSNDRAESSVRQSNKRDSMTHPQMKRRKGYDALKLNSEN
jgi:hypothetical protein